MQLLDPRKGQPNSVQGNKGKNLMKVAEAKDAWLMIHFVWDVLTILVMISERFQTREAVVAEVLLEIRTGIHNLQKLKNR